MHVELPRGDYLLAAFVAVSIALAVGLLTVLPAILFFDLLEIVAKSHWAKLILAVPVACGLLAAWSCLRRAKSDRVRHHLSRELRR
ncbi:MAG: hypothetical protein ACTHK7_06045 [Aureliella sp.]